jgi:hypothetical protein
MTEFSLFHVIAHDEQGDAIKQRKVVVAATQRLDARYSRWLQAPNFDARFAYIEAEAKDIVEATIDEFEATNVKPASILAAYRAARKPIATTTKEATTHEARKPRMCPFHKDVVDISLAQGDPKAGFEAMAQHWGGARHCEGDGYKGESCNFKPQMTTQSYWDEKAEKAQQKREERQQRELEQAPDAVDDEGNTELEDAGIDVPADDTTDIDRFDDESGHIDPVFQENDSSADSGTSESVEHPMLMAAKTATDATGLGGPVPTMDKRKWTPQNVRRIEADDPEGRWPTRDKDILDTNHPSNKKALTEIGETVTERQDVTRDSDYTRGRGQQSDQGQASGLSTAVDK